MAFIMLRYIPSMPTFWRVFLIINGWLILSKAFSASIEMIMWFLFFSLLTWCSVQSLSRVWLFATPWTAARQAFLSIINSWSPPKPMSTVLVMPSNHLILCHPLLLLPSIFPSIRVFPNESGLCIRWPKYWSFSFSISPSNEWCSAFFMVQLLHSYMTTGKTIALTR